MDANAVESALESWGVQLSPEGLSALEQSGITSPDAVKKYILSADLRRVHLASHPADLNNFSALVSRSMQAPPEAAAYAATAERPQSGASLVSKISLKKPLLCMVMSFQDVRLPSKDVDEDFSCGSQGIKGNQRRLLSLKLTDGRGSPFTGIELRFCGQLDSVPLLPGVKLLLLPGLILYRGIALLSPQYVQNLAGGAAQLQEAFKLKADVQERRKLVQHILNEHTELQQRIKADKGDTGPPKFVPFSFSAKVQHVDVRTIPSMQDRNSRASPPQESLMHQVELPPEASRPNPSEREGRSLIIDTNTAGLKQDRLRRLEK
ncbi:hypothetical protein cyc_01351, partial [Cyclospora cayetanensis]